MAVFLAEGGEVVLLQGLNKFVGEGFAGGVAD